MLLFHILFQPMISIGFQRPYKPVFHTCVLFTERIESRRIPAFRHLIRSPYSLQVLPFSGRTIFGKSLTETVPVVHPFSQSKTPDVQYQSITEVRLEIAYGQCLETLDIRQKQVSRIRIISFPVIFAEKGFARIFLGGKPNVNLIAVPETIAHIVIKRVAVITLVGTFRQGLPVIVGIPRLGVERDIQPC